MKKKLLLFLGFICASFFHSLDAQKPVQPMFFGYNVHLGYNVYQWQEKGIGTEKRSVGQAFNLLPTLGGGIWFGKRQWNLGLEAHVDYTPFAFDLQQYSGMGAVALPVMLNASYITAKNGGWLIRGAVGTQFQSSEWYFTKKGQPKVPTLFDWSLVGELGFGFVVGDFKRSHAWSIELYGRVGSTLQHQWGVYTGLRLIYWDTFVRYNPSKKKI